METIVGRDGDCPAGDPVALRFRLIRQSVLVIVKAVGAAVTDEIAIHIANLEVLSAFA